MDELFGTGGLDQEFGQESELEELTGDDDDDEDDEEGGEAAEREEDGGIPDEAAMKKAMKELEKKDPEFFNYLKENDRDLLSFGKEAGGKAERQEEVEEDDDEEDDEETEEEEERKKTSVTMKMLRQWQEGMLKVGLPSRTGRLWLRRGNIAEDLLATLAPVVTEDVTSVPGGRTHGRGRGGSREWTGHEVLYRQCSR